VGLEQEYGSAKREMNRKRYLNHLPD